MLLASLLIAAAALLVCVEYVAARRQGPLNAAELDDLRKPPPMPRDLHALHPGMLVSVPLPGE